MFGIWQLMFMFDEGGWCLVPFDGECRCFLEDISDCQNVIGSVGVSI